VGRTLIGDIASAAGSLFNRAAAPPIPLTSRAATRATPFGGATGATGQMRAMSSVGTLFAIVDRTSNATALVDWKLWRKAKSGRSEDRAEVTSHAALDLWNQPNPFMPRQEFVESFQQHHDLTGEAWWVIAKRPGISLPLEMWPVRPDRMTPIPDRDAFLKGYVYTSPDGEQIPLELGEVIQIRRPNPLDPYRGLSPVLSVLPDLDTARYSAEWATAFFRNSAQPGGIIEVPDRLSDEEFEELRTRWNEQHRGVGNAHRVAILEHGKWADRTISQRDMQFVELRGVTRDAIREAYGISKSALGDFEDINRASALAAKAWFAEQITVPRLERIKAALNFELLPMYGATAQGLEFDYCDPTPPDPETEVAELTARTSAYARLVDSGADPRLTADYLGIPEIAGDPDRAMLVRIVTGAPSTAPMILPLLGFNVPQGTVPAASNQAAEPGSWTELVAGITGGGDSGDGGDPENAMRWEAVEHDDDHTCDPCRENDGKLYRNREDAYADYPGGEGYIHCVGAEHGNPCRGRVRKRRAGS
jgi:HK97 family phage portal protein